MWTGSCSLFSCLPCCISEHNERPSLCAKKGHGQEAGGQKIPLPPRFLNLRVFYQHSIKRLPYTRFIKLKKRDATPKPVKKWFPFFFHLWKSFTDKCYNSKYCHGQLNSHRIHESAFSYSYHIWFLPVNMGILNIFLSKNKNLQKALTSGNLEQVFLKGSDQCKNKMAVKIKKGRQKLLESNIYIWI